MRSTYTIAPIRSTKPAARKDSRRSSEKVATRDRRAARAAKRSIQGR